MDFVRRVQAPIITSFIVFFGFLGHLFLSFIDILQGKVKITRHSLWVTVYNSGAKLLLPLLTITALLGASIIVNIYNILSPFDLQNKVLIISQKLLIYDFLPFLIGMMQAMQSALNMVNARINERQKTPHEVVLTYAIPIMIGTNFSAIFLYIYAINIVFLSIYICFRFLLQTEMYEFIFHLTNTLSNKTIFYSLFKMSLYCALVSLIVGYYYYQVASGYLIVRKAISRIITRSFIWLAVCSVYFKYINN